MENEIAYTEWTYKEFLAYALVYVAELDRKLSDEEIAFVRARTGIDDVLRFDRMIKQHSEGKSMEILSFFRKKYLGNADLEQAVRRDLEAIFDTEHQHQQFEKMALHLLEKII
ncbi:MAG: hypothetical protein U0T73_10845 [Chitinophagales bacterium]